MRLPTKPDGKIDIDHVKRMAAHYIDAGFNYFDTAYGYHNGESETAMRETVVNVYPRESFLLADKMPVWLVKKQADYARLFAEQQKRCNVEYFDNYMLHSLNKGSANDSEKLGGFEFIKQMKAEGKARNIGISFHDTADVLDALLSRHPELDFVQLQINYLDWDSNDAKGWYEVAVKHGKNIIVMEPVKGGTLANLPPEAAAQIKNGSQAQLAIRFAASLKNVVTVLSGMSNLEQVADNTGYMKDFKPLEDADYALIKTVLAEMSRVSVIPCTSCNYCAPECPQGIHIPTIFSVYNELQRSKNSWHAGMMYGYIPEKSRANGCIACGVCTSHCPQKIDIPNELKKVAGALK